MINKILREFLADSSYDTFLSYKDVAKRSVTANSAEPGGLLHSISILSEAFESYDVKGEELKSSFDLFGYVMGKAITPKKPTPASELLSESSESVKDINDLLKKMIPFVNSDLISYREGRNILFCAFYVKDFYYKEHYDGYYFDIPGASEPYRLRELGSERKINEKLLDKMQKNKPFWLLFYQKPNYTKFSGYSFERPLTKGVYAPSFDAEEWFNFTNTRSRFR
jgi:hypothetical protein